MRWLPSWRVVLGTFLTLAAVGAGLFFAAYQSIAIPEPDDFSQAETTNVYYADGETLMGSYAEYDRRSVDFETLPPHVGYAVVASEDRTFFENRGIDVRGIARALWNNLRGLPTQGGSTITQQYVERYYTGTTTSYTGKFREAILAVKIDRQSTKEEILGNYLNTIYFGRGAYGIEVAAQNFFGKPASELTISESALLAGIIPSPSNYDPAVSPEIAEQRWNRVLDLMLEDEWITQAERDAQQFPEVIEYVRADTFAGPNGYLLDMVRTELAEEAGIEEGELNTAGLSVVTTIEKPRQDAAVAAVENLPEDRPENNRVGLVSIDPTTGRIVALYGGPDFVEQSRNAVTQDRAQGGSTFKPFTLIAALEDGASLLDQYESYSPMEIPGYEFPVNNFDSRDRGSIDLIRATQDSVNTVYAQLNVEYGPERTVDVATRLGIPEDTPGLVATPSNVLGPASPHAIDTATAFGTIASGGVRHDPFIVDSVTDRDGNVRYRGSSDGDRVMDAGVIANATHAMRAVVEGGTGRTASEIGRPAAGKTGSSNAYRSAWFAGFVPQLVTVVNMYQVGPNGEEEELTGFGGVNIVAGGTWPTRVWTDYMKVALDGVEVQDFPEPDIKEPTRTPSPTPEPTTPTPTPTPTPTEEPTPTPEPTTPEPTPEPTRPGPPDPTEEPVPTEEPTAPGNSGGRGGGEVVPIPPPPEEA
jgi:membrane peptidoglycan carboxypeptidase